MTEPATIERTITQEQIARYADASGDHNPIHVDASFGAATQFEGTIAHGMLVLALVNEMMHAAHGEAWLSGGSLKVRFKAPTRPGDAVAISAGERRTIEDSTEWPVLCTNQRGETLIEGRARVRA